MGNGKRKIEIKKIENSQARNVCFSKRRKGLFKKASDLSRLDPNIRIAAVVFSPAGNPYVYGDPLALSSVNDGEQPPGRPYTWGDVSSINESFNGCSTNSAALHGSNDEADVNGTSATCSLEQWLENINVEACNKTDELMFLKQQLEETRENLVGMVDYEFVQSLLK